MLLTKGAKTMFIIVFTMILIVVTMIYIVFTKIGNVVKHQKNAWGQLLFHRHCLSSSGDNLGMWQSYIFPLM